MGRLWTGRFRASQYAKQIFFHDICGALKSKGSMSPKDFPKIAGLSCLPTGQPTCRKVSWLDSIGEEHLPPEGSGFLPRQVCLDGLRFSEGVHKEIR